MGGGLEGSSTWKMQGWDRWAHRHHQGLKNNYKRSTTKRFHVAWTRNKKIQIKGNIVNKWMIPKWVHYSGIRAMLLPSCGNITLIHSSYSFAMHTQNIQLSVASIIFCSASPSYHKWSYAAHTSLVPTIKYDMEQKSLQSEQNRDTKNQMLIQSGSLSTQ